MIDRYYFAYGSNMAASRINPLLKMRNRGTGFLENYKLVFNKISAKNNLYGFANIVPSWGDRVYGIMYDLSGEEPDLSLVKQNVEILDKQEGFPNHYQKTTVTIKHLESGLDIRVMTYMAVAAKQSKKKLLVSDDYASKIFEGIQQLKMIATDDYYKSEVINLLNKHKNI